MNLRKNISLPILILLLPAIIYFTHNQAANWHYHLTSAGLPVKHAHPYSKSELPSSPFANHSHTDSEYLVFGQMSQGFITLLFLLLIIGRLYWAFIFKFPPVSSTSFPEIFYSSLSSPRAPPVKF